MGSGRGVSPDGLGLDWPCQAFAGAVDLGAWERFGCAAVFRRLDVDVVCWTSASRTCPRRSTVLRLNTALSLPHNSRCLWTTVMIGIVREFYPQA